MTSAKNSSTFRPVTWNSPGPVPGNSIPSATISALPDATTANVGLAHWSFRAALLGRVPRRGVIAGPSGRADQSAAI